VKTKSKFKPKGTWREKLEKPMEPVIKPAPRQWAVKFGEKMLIPTPILVDNVVKKIRKGTLFTSGLMRNYLAVNNNADFTCPLTSGIFLRIVAETAEEDKEKGKKRVTPYWRMLKDDGTLNPKFPGGEETQAEKLRNEGFTIIKKGRTKLMVEDFEKYLIDLL
jgi:hypothetical protein